MRNAVIAFLLLVLIFFGLQIHSLYLQNSGAAVIYNQTKQELFKAKEDALKISSDLNYFLNPVNLEKELRARFNYKLPDEKLIIIVPKTSTSTP